MQNFSFLFLGANSPWAYGLAEALAQYHPTHAVQFYDWRTYYNLKPTWPGRIPPSLLNRSIHVLPPGYAGSLENLFRFYLQGLIEDWCRQLEQISGQNPWVIVPDPYFLPWVSKVPNERLIYYNFDDYVFYRPNRKQKVLKQEKELIERRVTITLCASRSQQITFQKRHPHKASQIYHYPHGVVDTYLNHQPENPPEPMTVGYVGTLGNRLDWALIYQVIKASPEITFVFVGGLDEQETFAQDGWQATRHAVLQLPNVRHIGQVPSDQVAKYYWSCAVNWIPYLIDHPFNKASCPTKIMDGIASGRPLLSTKIPECCLYPQWINLFFSPEDALALIHQELAASEKPKAYEKSLEQLAFARQQTWQSRTQTLENWLWQLDSN
ncbi:glycosyltransferase family protein [Gloeothece verrucosa]|uniref:Spore protein YkvP/CgeB glycosyl transferase-like domain-containing protein n=1 Tax=Gloeothece verrucosa (strain PCC 7822) TaxID=497965 RepID=E0UKW1_GLOV7|nr:glycosyltransferase [Gloeothece verrucosa]ADN17591.1 hypothetical protein Cyan7822_5730 [Gloeothece verrucosa PCC 7822]